MAKVLYTITEDAEILIPNKEHKSFSGTNKFIKAGEKVIGEVVIISGLRKKKPFDYKLFRINDKEYIHLNNIKITPTSDMDTEIKVGADGRPASTIINTTSIKVFGATPVIGGLIGAALGYAYCNYKKHDTKRTWLYTLAGAGVGYGVGRYIQTMQPIMVTPKIL